MTANLLVRGNSWQVTGGTGNLIHSGCVALLIEQLLKIKHLRLGTLNRVAESMLGKVVPEGGGATEGG
jgi:hypothetical protein